MAKVYVPKMKYFRSVVSTYLHNPESLRIALDIFSIGLARNMSVTSDSTVPPGDASSTGGLTDASGKTSKPQRPKPGGGV
jgi:hypothetical protein